MAALYIIAFIVAIVIIYSIYASISSYFFEVKEMSRLSTEIANKQKELKELNEQIEDVKTNIKTITENALREERNKLFRIQKANEKALREETEILIKTQNEHIKSLLDERVKAYPHIAGLIADVLTLNYDQSVKYLLHKQRPAPVEAQRIAELKKETRGYIQALKEAEYKLAYIEKLFPNITDIFEDDFVSEYYQLETPEDTDAVRFYVSDEEYRSLNESERNQHALDNYIAHRKSKWQVGRDYEMYIGYLYENNGFKVQYNGILEKLEDMGRDLIARKCDKVYIIQCKNWSQESTIYEKHIFQLYGTLILYKLDHPTLDANGVFVTTTSLSKRAKDIAAALDIIITENKPLGDFPRIKCNINCGKRIYHLPFDQQYDSVLLKEPGECMAFTVNEAEQKGFRRAYRWSGAK